MDTGAIIAGLSCAVAVLVPMLGFALRIDRRLTRLEAHFEALAAQPERRAANVAHFKARHHDH